MDYKIQELQADIYQLHDDILSVQKSIELGQRDNDQRLLNQKTRMDMEFAQLKVDHEQVIKDQTEALQGKLDATYNELKKAQTQFEIDRQRKEQLQSQLAVAKEDADKA